MRACLAGQAETVTVAPPKCRTRELPGTPRTRRLFEKNQMHTSGKDKNTNKHGIMQAIMDDDMSNLITCIRISY